MKLPNPRELSRRDFMLAGVTTVALASTGSVQAQSDTESEFQAAAVLVGPADARPEPGDGFFDRKTRYSYVYHATDGTTKSMITQANEQWTEISSSGGPWTDGDGDGLVELPNHDGVALDTLGVLLDSGDDVEVEHLGNASHVPHSFQQPTLALDDWRTPNPDRPTLVTVTFELNPGVTSSRVDLEVDESGGTTPDYVHPSAVPAALSDSQQRAPPSVVVPPGGSYRFNEVSTGDGAAVTTHTEHTL